MDYKLLEIEEYFSEDLAIQTEKLEKAKQAIADKEKDKKKPTQSQLKEGKNKCNVFTGINVTFNFTLPPPIQ